MITLSYVSLHVSSPYARACTPCTKNNEHADTLAEDVRRARGPVAPVAVAQTTGTGVQEASFREEQEGQKGQGVG